MSTTAVHTTPKSGIYTNTSARLHIIVAKVGPKKYRKLRVLPGESFDIPHDFAQDLEKSPAFRSGEIKRGRIEMPAGRKIDLSKADSEVAMRIVGKETDPKRLKDWAKSETRGDIVLAIAERMRQIA